MTISLERGLDELFTAVKPFGTVAASHTAIAKWRGSAVGAWRHFLWVEIDPSDYDTDVQEVITEMKKRLNAYKDGAAFGRSRGTVSNPHLATQFRHIVASGRELCKLVLPPERMGMYDIIFGA